MPETTQTVKIKRNSAYTASSKPRKMKMTFNNLDLQTMRIIKTITHDGHKAKIRLSEDGNLHLYVTWFTPDGKELVGWDKDSQALKNLYKKVKQFEQMSFGYTLWSY